MRALVTVFVAALAVACSSTGENMPELFERAGGLVPDRATAIAIAEAVLFPIYGEKSIREQRPYVVKHTAGKWAIDGSIPKGFVGGSFHIVIRQRDAKILEISHGA